MRTTSTSTYPKKFRKQKIFMREILKTTRFTKPYSAGCKNKKTRTISRKEYNIDYIQSALQHTNPNRDQAEITRTKSNNETDTADPINSNQNYKLTYISRTKATIYDNLTKNTRNKKVKNINIIVQEINGDFKISNTHQIRREK